jgi:hypothetical protein
MVWHSLSSVYLYALVVLGRYGRRRRMGMYRGYIIIVLVSRDARNGWYFYSMCGLHLLDK